MLLKWRKLLTFQKKHFANIKILFSTIFSKFLNRMKFIPRVLLISSCSSSTKWWCWMVRCQTMIHSRLTRALRSSQLITRTSAAVERKTKQIYKNGIFLKVWSNTIKKTSTILIRRKIKIANQIITFEILYHTTIWWTLSTADQLLGIQAEYNTRCLALTVMRMMNFRLDPMKLLLNSFRKFVNISTSLK